ncbi:hypothetical protein BDF22DRAFT_693600 [Syncephalis plumigaleata]|nr:hypothetical protein BDF22DRAFT_693600 [Syncephalis plumigaleata]
MSWFTSTNQPKEKESEQRDTMEDKSKAEESSKKQAKVVVEDDDEEEDPWDQRIRNTGCYEENTKLHHCYAKHRDWRACKDEMEAFRQCYARHANTNKP